MGIFLFFVIPYLNENLRFVILTYHIFLSTSRPRGGRANNPLIQYTDENLESAKSQFAY